MYSMQFAKQISSWNDMKIILFYGLWPDEASMIRPHLEYGKVVWHPYLKQDMELL